MKECINCLLTEKLEGVVIEDNGKCNYCNNYKIFKPFGEDALVMELNKAKRKNAKYDVLVPISGGKDSTYILYLATKIYNLKVLAFTYDNGLFSELALENIKNTVEEVGCEHFFYKPDQEVLKRIYKDTLISSGEICGVCGIGIMHSIQKVSEDHNIPLILLGHAPTEEGSFSSENIYDYKRLKTILKKSENFKASEINDFLIYPKLDYIKIYLKTKLNKFGKKINPLYYLPAISDDEMAVVLKREMNWKDSTENQFSKHFDCIAEPLTNYIRENRLGKSRRIFQLSNMIRNGEISKNEAMGIHKKDQATELPNNYKSVLELLNMNLNDLTKATDVRLGEWEWANSRRNQLFANVRSRLNIK